MDILESRSTNSKKGSKNHETLRLVSTGRSSISDARVQSLLNMGSCDVTTFRETGSTSTIGAIFIVMNAALGAAMLNMPNAFAQAGGVPASLLVQSLFVVFAYGGLLMLGYCAEFQESSVYQEVMKSMGGKKLEVVTELIILVFAFTTCISFMVLGTDQGSNILELLIKSENYNKHPTIYRYLTTFVISTCIILPLSLPKDVSFLQYPSIICTCAVGYVTVLVIVEYFVLQEDPTITDVPDSFEAVLNVVPTIAFGFQCHVSSVPVYSGLRKRNLKNWSVITFCAVLICFIVYSSVGTCGYLTFGNSVADDILSAYSTKSVQAIVGRFFVVISTTMSYPILHFCGRASLESITRKIMRMSDDDGRRTWSRRYYYQTLIWFVLAMLGAMVVPNIDTIIKPVGAFSALFVMGLPGFAFIKASQRIRTEIGTTTYVTMNLLGMIFIVVSAFLFGQSFTSGIYSIVG